MCAPLKYSVLVFNVFSRLLPTNSHAIQYFLLVSQCSHYTEMHTDFTLMQWYASH